jgi:phospholipid/cholesterol/gamma-HCH transport system substrate-binding protein
MPVLIAQKMSPWYGTVNKTIELLMGGKTNRLESIIALGVLVFVLFVIGGVYYKYYGHRHKGSTFYAEFDSITGLNLGAPVKINGVVVGKVETFVLDPRKSFMVNVGFSVDSSIGIPEDTKASVSSESLFGSTILMLSPGMSERSLAEGGTIFDTQSPLHIHELLQKFLFNSSDGDRDSGASRDHDGGNGFSEDGGNPGGTAIKEESGLTFEEDLF